jgi:LysM repeat protein
LTAVSRYSVHAFAVLIVIALAGLNTFSHNGITLQLGTAQALGVERQGVAMGEDPRGRESMITNPLPIPGQVAPSHDPIRFTVGGGDDLATMASRLSLPLEDILWSNPSLAETGHLVKGMVLVLPPVPGVVAAVHPGDTVAAIASIYHVDSELVADYNYLRSPNALQSGQLLVIPGGQGPPLFATPGNPYSGCHPTLEQPYGPTTFGAEPALKGYAHFHTGIDLSCGAGTPLHSVTAGVAHVTLGWGGGFGNNVVVEIRTRLPGDIAPHRYFIRYGHMIKVAVADGAQIHPGDTLGYEGSTGNSTGPHLHFEIDHDSNSLTESINPAPLLSL